MSEGEGIISNLLRIDDFMLVEESYAEQKWLGRTLEYMMRNIDADDLLEVARIYDSNDRNGNGNRNENGNKLLGIAICDKYLDFWIIFTSVIADKVKQGEFDALASKIKGAEERSVTVTRDDFHAGVIEFYSTGLMKRLFCDCDLKEASFYPRERIDLLKEVISDFLSEYGLLNVDTGTTAHVHALEIGCGNGGGTIALHESGIFPLALDVNRCEICKGLEEGILEPRKSIVLDCSFLSSFFDREFDVVFGFMVGKLTLTPFERRGWENVLKETAKVLKKNGKVLFTVADEEEAVILKDNILDSEFEGLIRENRRSKGYFDRWLYMGELTSSPP